MPPLMPSNLRQAVHKARVIEPIESRVALIDQDHAQLWNPKPKGIVSPSDLGRRKRAAARGAEQLVRVDPKGSSADLPLIGTDLLQEVAISLWQLLPCPPHDFLCLRHVPTTLGRPGARVARIKSNFWANSETTLGEAARS